MGNFSGETVIGRTGSSIPARIAADLLKALEQTAGGEKGFPPVPDSAREIQICALSGMAAGPYCSGAAREWLPADKKETNRLCSWHRQPGAVPVYPPEYQAWLAERFRKGSFGTSENPGLQTQGSGRIRIPVSGSVFYFDPALPPEAQAIRVETAGFEPGAFVYANDILQGSLNHAGVFALSLRRGRQRIAVEDGNSTGEVEIEVR